MDRKLLRKLLLGMIVILSAAFLSSCANLGWNTVTYLTSRDKVYVVPKDALVPVLENGKIETLKTDTEMVLVDKGKYYNLEKEANENVIR